MSEFVKDDVQMFTATGAGRAINPLPNTLPLVFSVSGKFTGTVAIEYQHGDGGDWIESAHALTAPGLILVDNPGPGVGVRMNCTQYKDGAINARLTHQRPSNA